MRVRGSVLTLTLTRTLTLTLTPTRCAAAWSASGRTSLYLPISPLHLRYISPYLPRCAAAWSASGRTRATSQQA